MLHVVLVRPLIHVNTGNIGRTCLGFGARLHLVKPLGFSLDDRLVKRAGLDYWKDVDLCVHEDWDAFERSHLARPQQAVVFSKSAQFGERCLYDFAFPREESDLYLVFGNEDQGLRFMPSQVIRRYAGVYLPMSPAIRSYNLANSVAMAVCEAGRQRRDLVQRALQEEAA